MNVLVIENDKNLLAFFDNLMSRWGHFVFKASSAKQGLKIVNGNNIKLVLMEIFLKDDIGYDLIPRLKTLSPQIQIIAMTGNSNRELESRIRTQGVLYYLIKPFEIVNLNAIINHLEPKNDIPEIEIK